MSTFPTIIEDSYEQIYSTKDPIIQPEYKDPIIGSRKQSCQEEVYTTWEKVFICLACISANFTVVFAFSVYSPIEREFTNYYKCDEKAYFWFLQINLFTSMLLVLPQAIFACKYPRYGMQLCIIGLIIGP